jgi:hypothetical protein
MNKQIGELRSENENLQIALQDKSVVFDLEII